MHYDQKRHETGGNPVHAPGDVHTEDWRMRDRLKTVSAVLALCLNLGVDPPDVIKTNPCARLESWVDPLASTTANDSSNSIMTAIGKNLQGQYETISMRTRFRLMGDPTNEEMKKYSSSLRRTAKDERILYHYNGHGVPKPTTSGEIWVFNKGYTQYIPISLHELQNWLGAPTLFVYDCSEADIIIQNYNTIAEKHEQEIAELAKRDPTIPSQHFSDCIHLAACAANESLPINPLLPADLFTCCLTTPIEIAIRTFILQNPLDNDMEQDIVKEIPGKHSERRTPIGELNWIFTAITDTIAWTYLPKHLFKKLFRQDLMVAALFRNFLLAQRIMRRYGCHPQCHPSIPSCHDHPLWDSWDLAIELVLAQVPNFVAAKEAGFPEKYEYHHSDFFAEQLTAFEVYLEQGAVEQKEPEQLPVVLQVLLSQAHRLRALIDLSKFLDLGPWAVNLALGIGIFPYVLKLLQSQAMELKPVMTFIWARILAVDQSCQADLLKENGYQYFISILNPASGFPIKIVAEHRAMCAFIIAMFCNNFRQGQAVAMSEGLIKICLSQVGLPASDNPLLRQWVALCLSMLWKNFPDAKWAGIRCSAHARLCRTLDDPVPEVRAAVTHALTNFIGIPEMTEQIEEMEENITASLLTISNDGSHLVRKELVIFFSAFIGRYESKFIVAAYEDMIQEKHSGPHNLDGAMHSRVPSSNSSDDGFSPVSKDSVHAALWKNLLIMEVDPDPEVSRDAKIVVDYVMRALLKSPLGPYAGPVLEEIVNQENKASLQAVNHTDVSRPPSLTMDTPTSPSAGDKADGYFSLGMKRTASVAQSLKNLAFGTPLNGPQGHARNASWRGSRQSLQPVANGIVHPEERPYTGPYEKARFPTPKYFKDRPESAKLKMPLQSALFDFSTEYFREPQMRRSENDEPGSVEYNHRLWRRNRNERILDATQKLKEHAGSSKWDNGCGTIDVGVQPMRLCFHQYDNHLAVTDDRDNVRIWDWKKQKCLSSFSNGNPARSKITGTRFINEDDRTILMTGSSDGVIKLYGQYDNDKSVFLTSSYRALTDLVPSTHNAGLIFEWLQGRGETLVAGDAKVIRVWSAERELCNRDIPARSGSCVTSLTADQVEGHVFVAGFGDGAVRVYDQREKNQTSLVQQWKEHTQWVTNVQMQRGGQRELVSGSRNGEVKLWDIRMGRSIRTVRASRDSLRSLAVHEHAPVFVTLVPSPADIARRHAYQKSGSGTDKHFIKFFNMSGAPLSAFQPSTSFMGGTRSAPISATTFHPHRMMVAAGALGDNHVSLFECHDAKGGIGFSLKDNWSRIADQA